MKLFVLFTSIAASLLAGCTLPPAGALTTPPAPTPIQIAVQPTKLVETPYDMRGYYDPSNHSVRHEAHTVYRQTRVPISDQSSHTTTTRDGYAPASIAPLTPSDELAAELSTQKKITADLRAMQATLAETEQKMKTQYALLVRQSEEVMKLRQLLETEQARLHAQNLPETSSVAQANVTSANTDAKW
jgi:hypothetical protein